MFNLSQVFVKLADQIYQPGERFQYLTQVTQQAHVWVERRGTHRTYIIRMQEALTERPVALALLSR